MGNCLLVTAFLEGIFISKTDLYKQANLRNTKTHLFRDSGIWRYVMDAPALQRRFPLLSADIRWPATGQ